MSNYPNGLILMAFPITVTVMPRSYEDETDWYSCTSLISFSILHKR